MDYQSVSQAAQRLGVTQRAIQKWAKDGKIDGATKLGRSWLIPVDVKAPCTASTSENEKVHGVANDTKHTVLPLLNASFEPGKCMEYINSIEDKDERKIALGEYYYFSAQPQKAIETLEEYLDSDDEVLKYSASLICMFSGFAAGQTNLPLYALRSLKEQFHNGLKKTDVPIEARAVSIFTSNTADVLLHLPLDNNTPNLEEYLRYLPAGIKLQACYVLAHQAYLEGDYVRALTIVDVALALCPQQYPIATIYVKMVGCMALMKLKRVEEAKERMQRAWEIASKDGFIEPYIEHHGLLQGMVEVFFKKGYPQQYNRIVNAVQIFHNGWRDIHNTYADGEITDKLTTTEFIIAMLYGHGWSVKEVAEHMELSARTVTNYISTIYSKLYINDKKGLIKYILK